MGGSFLCLWVIVDIDGFVKCLIGVDLMILVREVLIKEVYK